MVSNAPIGITVPLESLGLPNDGYQFIKMLWDTGYLMHLVKGIELVCGIALVVNAYVPLALIILMPILINIAGVGFFIFHSNYNIRLVIAALVLMLYHRKTYVLLLKLNAFNPTLEPSTRFS